jgi:hypothetical protein
MSRLSLRRFSTLVGLARLQKLNGFISCSQIGSLQND